MAGVGKARRRLGKCHRAADNLHSGGGSIRMKTNIGRTSALLLIAAVLGALPARADGGRAPWKTGTRVVWVRPELVPPARRIQLSLLLERAVSGLPLCGVEVRDSRPQPVAA